MLAGQTVNPVIVTDDDDDSSIPAELRNWLVRLRLLQGVPFANLVADTELLPEESIRWFYLDRALDRRARAGRAQRRHGEQRRPHRARRAVPGDPRRARRGGAQPAPRAGGDRTAFGGPGRADQRVPAALAGRRRAGRRCTCGRSTSSPADGDDARFKEDDPRRMRLLRLERLAPAVLLCLFDGIPTRRPHRGAPPGRAVRVRRRRRARPTESAVRLDAARNADTSSDLAEPDACTVPFRPGRSGRRRHPGARARPGRHPGDRRRRRTGRRRVRPAAGALPVPPGVGRPTSGIAIRDVFVPTCRTELVGQRSQEVTDMSDEFSAWASPATPTRRGDGRVRQRWTALAHADVDLGTIATWDPTLPRDTRILVPVDVQALRRRRPARSRGAPCRSTGGRDGDPDAVRRRRRRARPACTCTGRCPTRCCAASPRRRRRRTGSRCRRCPTAGSSCAPCCRRARARAIVTRLGDRRRKTASVTPLDRLRRHARPTPPAGRPVIDPLDGALRRLATVDRLVRGAARTASRSTTRSPTCPARSRSRRTGSTATTPSTPSPAGGATAAQDPLTGIAGSRPALDRRLAPTSAGSVAHDGDRRRDSRTTRASIRMRRAARSRRSPTTSHAVEVVRQGTHRALPARRRSIAPARSPCPSTRVTSVIIGAGAAAYSTRCCTAACSACRSTAPCPPADDRPAAERRSASPSGSTSTTWSRRSAPTALGLSGDAAPRQPSGWSPRSPATCSTARHPRRHRRARGARARATASGRSPGPPLPAPSRTGCAPRTRWPFSPTTVGRKGRGALAPTTTTWRCEGCTSDGTDACEA